MLGQLKGKPTLGFKLPSPPGPRTCQCTQLGGVLILRVYMAPPVTWTRRPPLTTGLQHLGAHLAPLRQRLPARLRRAVLEAMWGEPEELIHGDS